MLSSLRDDLSVIGSYSDEFRKFVSPFLGTLIFSKRRSYFFFSYEYSDKFRLNTYERLQICQFATIKLELFG